MGQPLRVAPAINKAGREVADIFLPPSGGLRMFFSRQVRAFWRTASGTTTSGLMKYRKAVSANTAKRLKRTTTKRGRNNATGLAASVAAGLV